MAKRVRLASLEETRDDFTRHSPPRAAIRVTSPRTSQEFASAPRPRKKQTPGQQPPTGGKFTKSTRNLLVLLQLKDLKPAVERRELQEGVLKPDLALEHLDVLATHPPEIFNDKRVGILEICAFV